MSNNGSASEFSLSDCETRAIDSRLVQPDAITNISVGFFF